MKVDPKSLEVIYKGFVQRSMEYANIVLGGSYDSEILKFATIHVNVLA